MEVPAHAPGPDSPVLIPDMLRSDPPSFQIADVIVQTLVALGVRHYCICPGSRSTPLVLNIWRDASASHTIHHDERSAAFQALGRSLTTGDASAVVTTSGTAVAELLPATVEASQSNVPLVLLTADRPARLRGTGSNQTILQPGIFGPYVRAELDVPAIVSDHDEWQRELSDQVTLLVQSASGPRPGPVHLNAQFDKPFEPAELARRATAACPKNESPEPHAHMDLSDEVRSALVQSSRGVIVVGPNRIGPPMLDAVHALSVSTAMPIVADPLSGCRFPVGTRCNVVSHGDALLQAGLLENLRPDLIVRFGSLPVSTRLIAWWSANLSTGGTHIYVNNTGEVHDDTNAITEYVAGDPVSFCHEAGKLQHPEVSRQGWLSRWQELNALAERTVRMCSAASPRWDLGTVRTLIERLGANTILIAGNSLPIRLLDSAGIGLRDGVILGNRGASGIDGLLATALGVAGATSKQVVLLIGDVSMLHDVGSLAEVRRQNVTNLCCVVLNNDGGRIFERLPVTDLADVAEQLFVAPHGLDFAGLASAFGLDHRLVSELSSLDVALSDAMDGPPTSILEVRTSAADDLAWERHYIDLLRHAGAS